MGLGPYIYLAFKARKRALTFGGLRNIQGALGERTDRSQGTYMKNSSDRGQILGANPPIVLVVYSMNTLKVRRGGLGDELQP